MTFVLACDVGQRRTGMAFGNLKDGTVMALDTILHRSKEELCHAIKAVAASKHATHLVLGLPLLPGGDEGKQSSLVREVGDLLSLSGLVVEYLDERYTTPPSDGHDGDARAACEILLTFFSRNANSDPAK